MNILRKAFTMTPEDRALAREISAYPAKASSAVVVLPNRASTYLDTPHVAARAADAQRPSIPHLRVRLG